MFFYSYGLRKILRTEQWEQIFQIILQKFLMQNTDIMRIIPQDIVNRK